eukprot:TRINITY_DN9815_c0_g1_i1.p2 TRINITY_DN9815_c0_g1~~TRINITY_DN9815_c0_g1_i1.p2  ORF type:complete len:275 (-),score=79.36 TRINITY_DN9815_c0_g1_i1:18-842(-)
MVEHGCGERVNADCTTLGAMHAQMVEAGKATNWQVQIVADALSQHAAGVYLPAEKATHSSQPESSTSIPHETGVSASEDGIHGSALFPEVATEAGTQTPCQDIETVATALAKHVEGLNLRASTVNQLDAGNLQALIGLGAGATKEMELHNKVQAAAAALLRHASAIDLNEMELQSNARAAADALFRHATMIGLKETELHNNVRDAADALLRHAAAIDLKAEAESQEQIDEAIVAEEVEWPPSPGSVAGELLSEDVSIQLMQQVFAFVDEFDSDI